MTIWIGTGWKMHKVLADSLDYAATLGEAVASLDDRIQPFVVPPHTVLRDVVHALSGTRVAVGAQNMHWAEEGAWTGEVSASMLRDCGATLIELGHSERRTFFNETNETVGWKTRAAVRHGLVPLICVGETLEEREAGSAKAVLIAQVEGALSALDGGQRDASILFAYEPVWAIGESGVPATPEYADRQQALIAETGESVLTSRPPVLYGGSVNAGNAVELLAQPNVDGLFIGRAAWSASGYIGILRLVEAMVGHGATTARTSTPTSTPTTTTTRKRS